MKNQLEFLDILSIMSFVIALQNLDMNISEQDIAEQTTVLNDELSKAIQDIHEHLSVQDAKINALLNRLEDIYDSR